MACRTVGKAVPVLLALLLGSAPADAQQGQGTVTGRVTEQGTGQPIPEVQIAVVGTTIGARTNAEGRYTLRGVPAGQVRVRAVRIGYGESVRSATVGAEPATLDFALSRSAVQLQEIVTTATGEQRRVELGNTIANVRVADVTATQAVSSVSDVINSRAPGVVVTGGTQTGSGARIRIRGQSSLNLSNDPIYIIDGVRMTSNMSSSSLFTGGAQPSRVGDLNPDEIENIEIVKGPSAATLYGTDAANGVILITTKRGRSGPAKWTAYAETGMLEDKNTYPTNYSLWGRSPNSTTARECTLPQVSAGTCIRDSVTTLNIFSDPETTPLKRGGRDQLGLQVGGGSDLVTYFLSAERETERGTLGLPRFERERYASSGLAVEDWVRDPNVMEKNSFRVNLGANVTPTLNVSVSSGYVNLQQRYTQESNATAGIGSHAFGGPGHKNNGVVSGLGTPLKGYRAWTPGYTYDEKVEQTVNRFIGSTTANWRPLSWMANNLSVGVDHTGRVDDNLLRRGEGPPLTAIYRNGFKDNRRTDLRNITVDLASSGTFQPRDWLNSRTTVGAQYVNYSLQQTRASGTDLPPGSQTVSGAAIPTATEATTLEKTLGFFLEQQVAFNDRLFLTAAVRTDQNSAFGTDFQNVVYPKGSVSWIVTDEPFFPDYGWLNQLRFRAAYGSAGVQPQSNDALRAFNSTTANIRGVDQPGVIYTAIGNSELRPEKTTEFESGFEMRVLDRATLDVTYYSKRTKDALINAIVPPSYGAAINVRENLGSTRNSGWEVLLTTQLLDRPAYGWDVTLNGSTNANKLVSLGNTPPQILTTSRVVEGYPLFGWWERPITGWEDKNNDGILTYNADPALNEVFVADSAEFLGYTQPRHNVSLTNGIEVLDRRLRLTTMFDYRGGHLWYNNTERIRCVSRANCNGLKNPNASFEEQAMVVASRDHPSRSVAGYMQKGDFVRLREVALTYSVPSRWLQPVRGVERLDLNLSGRNLAVWTGYRGIDPEIDRTAGDSSDRPDEFQTTGPPRVFVFRVNVGF